MHAHKNNAITDFLSHHPLIDTLKKWQVKVSKERPKNIRKLSTEAQVAYIRFRWILRIFISRIENMNPMLTQDASLSSAEKAIEAMQASWEQYIAAPEAQAKSLISDTDGLLPHLRKFPESSEYSAWKTVFDEAYSDISESLLNSNEAVKKLQAASSATNEEFLKAKNNLSNLTNEIQSQKARLDEMLNQQSKNFISSEQERTEKFSTAQTLKQTQWEAQKEEFENLRRTQLDDFEKKFGSLTAHAEKKSNDSFSKIESQLKKAVETVGTIVNTTMSGNYQIIANREYRNGWIMRSIAIASFSIMGAMIIWAVYSMHADLENIQWRDLTFRLSLGGFNSEAQHPEVKK